MQTLNVSLSEKTGEKVVVLISSVSKKQNTDNGLVAAKDLYQSPLFKKSLDYATDVLKISEELIFVLSAEHHLLLFDRCVMKYDKTLNNFTVSQRKAWADEVWCQLSIRFDKDTRYIMLAGKNYYQYLICNSRITNFELPLENNGIGRRLSILKSAISNKTISK